MRLFRDDLGLPQRSAPIHFADAHRIGDDDSLLALLRFREVIDTVLGKIHHNAFPWTWGQNPPARQKDIGALPRQPHVDVGVRADDLLVPEAVASRYVE